MADAEDKSEGGGQVEQAQPLKEQFTSYSFYVQQPYTLHPPRPSYLIDSIRFNGELVSQEILTRLDTCLPGQKVVVGFGELHENGAHIVLENDVVHKMVVKGVSCAFAVEWPPNNIDLHIDDEMRAKTTDKEGLKSLLRRSGNERLRDKLSADTTPIRSNNARLSRTVLHQYMDNHHIPVFSSDASRNWNMFVAGGRTEQYLLTGEQKVGRAVVEAAHILQIRPDEIDDVPINALWKIGMLARNLYMLHEVDEIVGQCPDAEVIFLQAGRAHITGNHALLPEPSPYEHGLSHLFAERRGHIFIAAPFYGSDTDRDTNTPPDALADPQLLPLQYLENTPFNVVTSNISDRTEAHQLLALSPYFEFIEETLGGRDARELRQQRQQGLMDVLERFRDEHHLSAVPDPLPH